LANLAAGKSEDVVAFGFKGAVALPVRFEPFFAGMVFVPVALDDDVDVRPARYPKVDVWPDLLTANFDVGKAWLQRHVVRCVHRYKTVSRDQPFDDVVALFSRNPALLQLTIKDAGLFFSNQL
jgi:hypothetical protein